MKLFEAHYKHRLDPRVYSFCIIINFLFFRLLSSEEFYNQCKTLKSAVALATEQGPDGQQPTTIYDIDVKNAQGETVSLSV